MSFCVRLDTNGLVSVGGRSLDPAAWRLGPPADGQAPAGSEATAMAAMTALSRSVSLRHLVLGVIGPRDATAAQASVARAVGIPLPTGLGEARNMVIAKAARVLIAVGGSYGTLSEVAYGLHFGKAVIGREGAPAVDGVQHADTVGSAMEMAMAALLAAAERGSAA